MNQLINPMGKKDDQIIKRIGKNGLEGVFDCVTLRRILFPKDVVVSFWVPFGIMKENIDEILAEKAFVLGSNVSTDSEHSKAMLSIGHPFSCELGYIYNLDVYGTYTKHLNGHIAGHLRNVMTHCAEKTIIFEIFTEPDIKVEVENIMLRFGFNIHRLEAASGMYCVKDIRKNFRSKM